MAAQPKQMPFRIKTPEGLAADGKNYLERLVLLMPTEIVALYLAGRSSITGYFEANVKVGADVPQAVIWIVWTLVCLGLLMLLRGWGTSDKERAIKPEWWAVALAGVSFLIWAYSCGDVFKFALHIWNPLVATLLVLVWTFITPLIYNPDRTR